VPVASLGSRSSTVRRRSSSVLPTLRALRQATLLQGRTGDFSSRFDVSAAARMSSSPMVRTSVALAANSGDFGVRPAAASGGSRRPWRPGPEARLRARPGPSGAPRSSARARTWPPAARVAGRSRVPGGSEAPGRRLRGQRSDWAGRSRWCPSRAVSLRRRADNLRGSRPPHRGASLTGGRSRRRACMPRRGAGARRTPS
jgi:hypothetical protein